MSIIIVSLALAIFVGTSGFLYDTPAEIKAICILSGGIILIYGIYAYLIEKLIYKVVSERNKLLERIKNESSNNK